MSLDKVFKNHSLEALHYQLKHPKKMIYKEFDFKTEIRNVDNLYVI